MNEDYLIFEELSKKIIGNLNIKEKKILNPTSDNANFFNNIDTWNKNIYFMGKNEKVKEELKNKKHKWLGENFLTFQNDIFFDIILMFPTIDKQASYFLKAWEISEKETEIRCVFNVENLKNTLDENIKKIFKIIEKNLGEIEYFNLGFYEEGQLKKIELALVKVKNNEKKSKFQFEYEKEFFKIEELDFTQLSKRDTIENLVDNYNHLQKLIVNYIKITEEINYYTKDIFRYTIFNILGEPRGSASYRYNEIMQQIKSKFWSEIFEKTQINEKLTSKVRDKFAKEKENRSIMPFTKHNIEDLLRMLILQSEIIFQNCIEECFDYLTMFYPENRVSVEGWKTNEKWEVGDKFILPNFLSDTSIKYLKENCVTSLDYNRNKIEDLEKSLCFISKKNYLDINDIQKVISGKIILGTWYDSEFFKFKLYKKGTMHFIFKDKNLKNKFNEIACKNKNWLKYKEN